MITTEDNFLTTEENKFVLDYCLSAKFRYGTTDNPSTPPNGMVSDILSGSEMYKFFQSKVERYLNGLKIYWVTVNVFAPEEIPYFHTDCDEGVTFIYYPQENWHMNDGGTTEFFVDNQIIGILPIQNRLLYFDANIPHRATAFRDRYRFTVALRCNKEGFRGDIYE